MIERDYIMRLVQQLAAVATRILRLRELEKYDQAQQELEQAYGELLGLQHELLLSLDAATAAQLLGHEEKIKIAAKLMQEESALLEHQGRFEQAHARRQRALELYLEALALAGYSEEEDGAILASLCQKIDVAELAERYQEILSALPLS